MWEKFRWLFLIALKFKRTPYPRTKIGARLVIASIALFVYGAINVDFESGYIISKLSVSENDAPIYSVFLSILTFSLGSFLIFTEWNIKTRHIAKVFISAMPSVSDNFPDEVLDTAERGFWREPVTIGVSHINIEDISVQVERYNAELNIDVFKRYILHEKGQRLYIGGLARVPILVSYGAMLRNISSQILYFDKFHREGNWALLTDENLKISFADVSLVNKVNSNGDIGLAIGFTTNIKLEHLPTELRNATTILLPKVSAERNLIKNQENLHAISEEVGHIIDQLSSVPDCKRVHLFLSVQSTLAIELGRRYQEGTHKNWVIHNFDASKGAYCWAIELSKSGLSEYIYPNQKVN